MTNRLYAGFTKRMFAFIVDAMVANAIGSILLKIVGGIMGRTLDGSISSAVTTLVFLFYFTLLTYFNDGQTFGKMIFNLKVVTIDGEKLDVLTVFIREFVGRYIHLFSFFWVLYAVTGLTPKKQNMSDFFASTSVLDLDKMACYVSGKQEVAQQMPQTPIIDEGQAPVQMV